MIMSGSHLNEYFCKHVNSGTAGHLRLSAGIRPLMGDKRAAFQLPNMCHGHDTVCSRVPRVAEPHG